MNGLKKLKEYIKKNLVLIAVIMLLVAIIFPVILDVLDIGKYIPFYKNTSPDGWLGVIAALLGFSGIFITIRHTDKQFREDKRISVKPYLNMTNICEITSDSLNPHNIIFINGDGFNRNCLKRFNLKIKLEFENLGIGNALDCRILSITSTSKIYKLVGEDIVFGAISSNKNKDIRLEIEYYDDGHIENKIYNYKASNITQEIHEYIRKETSRDIEILVEYKDILNNWYEKKFVLECFLDANLNPSKIEVINLFPSAEIKRGKFKEKYIGIKRS